nr:ribonuclease H-like domain-containing protein [Tanacetum cinerariifolium]
MRHIHQEDMAYLHLNFTRNHEDTSSIRRIQNASYAVSKKIYSKIILLATTLSSYKDLFRQGSTSGIRACKETLSVSTEDANQKFLRSLPSSWSQVSLIMRTKPGVDTLSFNDLYNNLRVFESNVKGSTASSSSTHNVVFVSSDSTSSTNKACFVCGSFSNLIRDCDFHEKRMAKHVELNKSKNKVASQRNDKLVWNNVQRLNHQNKFVPTAILTKTGRFPVNAVRQKFSSQAVSTSTVRKVNTARPIANDIRPRDNLYKSHSPIRRPFNRTTAPKANFENHKVNTAVDKTVSAVGGNRETAVKASAGCNWRSKRHYWNKDDPQQTLKGKGIVDSGCSRHMSENKAYLVEYQDFNSGHVAFGGSKGQITGKGKIQTGKLDFEDVYFVKELQHFNLFSMSQICDKKNKVLFTYIECLVLSPDFKLPDENQVLLRVPRQNNMYSFNLENIVPTRGLACLIAKATVDESNKWHKRLCHGHRQEERIDYDEVFAYMARIEAIGIFLAFASNMGFIVCFIDPKFPKKVYTVVKALYDLYQAPRAWKRIR